MVRRKKVQVVHTLHETSDLWAAPIAKLSGCPIVISSRRDMGFNRQPKHHVAYRLMGKYFTQVHAVSEQVRQWHIHNDRLEPNRVLTIHNGIDVLPADITIGKRQLRQQLGLGHATRLITSVGHVRHVKGVDILLRAAVEVIREYPGVVFAVAGKYDESEYATQLRNSAETLGLSERFIFLGNVVDIPQLLRASDVFCLLSRTEGLSNALWKPWLAGCRA